MKKLFYYDAPLACIYQVSGQGVLCGSPDDDGYYEGGGGDYNNPGDQNDNGSY